MESMAQGGDLPRQEDGKRATAQIGCWDTQVAVMESEDNRVEGVHKASTPRGPGSWTVHSGQYTEHGGY